MRVSTLLTVISVAGGALADCAGASGCCCRDFDKRLIGRGGDSIYRIKSNASPDEVLRFFREELGVNEY